MAENKYNDINDRFSDLSSMIPKAPKVDVVELLDIDELKVYFGKDYWPTDKICIHQPTIGDLIEYGDTKFYSMVSTLCANPTSFRLQLWDMGIDWNEIKDFDLFKLIIKNYTPNETRLLFGDLNLSWFEEFHNNESDCDVLVYIPRDENDNPMPLNFNSLDELTCIYEKDYVKIVEYLRYMFNIHPKVEKAKGKGTKKNLIEEDRMNIAAEQIKNKKKKVEKSTLLPLISSMLNHPGFKYKKSELKEVGIVEFMDSVKRLQVYESSTALMKGVYSGMVDTSKIKNLDNQLNWMKSLNE